MIYGVKVIHTHTVGENERRYYEELILRVKAESFDDAYEKAERYMTDASCDYVNPNGEAVKTLSIEAVDCFLAFESEGDVQEVFSSFSVNNSTLSEEEYHLVLTSACEKDELYSLQNKEFNT